MEDRNGGVESNRAEDCSGSECGRADFTAGIDTEGETEKLHSIYETENLTGKMEREGAAFGFQRKGLIKCNGWAWEAISDAAWVEFII